MEARQKVLIAVLGLVTSGVMIKVWFSMIGDDNQAKANLAVMARTPRSFVALEEQTKLLDSMTSDISQFTLAQIKDELEKTNHLVKTARQEFVAQNEAWVKVSRFAEKDMDSFIELKRKLDEVQRLQDEEIVRLNELLEESQKDSFFESLFGFIFSFSMGVLSSIAASHLYERYKTRQAG